MYSPYQESFRQVDDDQLRKLVIYFRIFGGLCIAIGLIAGAAFASIPFLESETQDRQKVHSRSSQPEFPGMKDDFPQPPAAQPEAPPEFPGMKDNFPQPPSAQPGASPEFPSMKDNFPQPPSAQPQSPQEMRERARLNRQQPSDGMAIVFSVVFALVFIVIYGGLGTVNLLAANWIRDRRNWTGIIVVSVVSLLMGLIGIALGVYSLVTLMRPSVKAQFTT